jgi:hypothetical protein
MTLSPLHRFSDYMQSPAHTIKLLSVPYADSCITRSPLHILFYYIQSSALSRRLCPVPCASLSYAQSPAQTLRLQYMQFSTHTNLSAWSPSQILTLRAVPFTYCSITLSPLSRVLCYAQLPTNTARLHSVPSANPQLPTVPYTLVIYA